MRFAARAPIVLGLLALLSANCAREGQQTQEGAADAEMAAATARGQVYPNIVAATVFENERVVAQRVTGQPGVWAGEHSHAGNQLAIVLRGATQLVREGGEETTRTFEDGEVFWVEATEAHDHTMQGDASVEAILITITGMDGLGGMPQSYPNQAADIVLENDHVIVQRLTPEPGAWVGEHSHAEGQIAVTLTGETVTYREAGQETVVTRAAGDVFAVEPTEAHDHAVTSESNVEVILITLK